MKEMICRPAYHNAGAVKKNTRSVGSGANAEGLSPQKPYLRLRVL